MADEQPQPLSQGEQPVDASAVTERSASVVETPSDEEKSPSWWQRLTRRQPASKEEPRADTDAAPSSETSTTLTLTQEELNRRVQSETDRREAERAKAQRAAERRKLRDTDPWAYADQERKEEEALQGNFQLESFVTDLGAAHDRVTVDPIFLALPKAEQERIQKLEGAGRGLDGRKLVVTESLKALEKHWKAEGAKEAEQKLRRNSAFRKQVLNETRGTGSEPEFLPGSSGSAADQTVSALLRSRYGIGGGHSELNGR